MIAVALLVVFGFAFGYVVVGPIADSYSARAYFPLITFVVFVIGFMAILALILQGLVEGRPVSDFGPLFIALGGWLLYAAAIAAGVSIKVSRRRAAA